MITKNGLQVIIDNKNRSNQDLQDAEQWAKEACDRIFSHYSKQEMETMRKQNG
jgi:hypothetical protein